MNGVTSMWRGCLAFLTVCDFTSGGRTMLSQVVARTSPFPRKSHISIRRRML
jgi:hypothetical protein